MRDKFSVTNAYLCIGYVPGNEAMYERLQKAGYILIFKPTLVIRHDGKETVKGNVDAELVLHTMIQWPHYDRAVIVSGDGDFHCLLSYLQDNEKLYRLIIPNRRRFSALLRNFRASFVFMDGLRTKLVYKHKERE